MGLSNLVRAIYNALVGSTNSLQTTFAPAAGTVGAVTTGGKAAYGAWATLVAVATIADPSWLVGIEVDTPAQDADVASFDVGAAVQVGTGAAGFEVAAGAVKVGLHHIKLTAVGEWTQLIPQIPLPRPIQISGAPRLAARIATDDAANTHNYSVTAALGVGFGT